MKCGDGSMGGATIERAMLGTHRRGCVSRCCVLVLRAPECVRRGHEMSVPDARAHRASLGGRGDGWISRRRLLGRSALGVHPATGAARALGLGGWGGREEGPEGRSRILVRRLVRRGTLEVELHPDGRRLRHRRALRGLARGGLLLLRGGRRLGEEGCDWRGRFLRGGLLGGHRRYDRTPLCSFRVSPQNVDAVSGRACLLPPSGALRL